jgi:hypothetical protein
MYRIGKRFQKGSTEQALPGQYNTIEEAKASIQTLMLVDAGLSMKTVYVLHEGMDELESFETEQFIASQSGSASSGSQQGAGSGQSFNPTPFQTSPRPAGLPPSSFRDEKKDKT